MTDNKNFDYWDIVVLVLITIMTYLIFHLVRIISVCMDC